MKIHFNTVHTLFFYLLAKNAVFLKYTRHLEAKNVGLIPAVILKNTGLLKVKILLLFHSS